MKDLDHQATSGKEGVQEQDWARLIRLWAHELGLEAVGIAVPELEAQRAGYAAWLAAGCHGSMDYMVKHRDLRFAPEQVLPGCRSVVMVRLDYRPAARPAAEVLADPGRGYVSRYALGRDYHKVLRRRLARLAQRLSEASGAQCRPFVDSAPVLEVALAERSGLGWRGKHTLLLSRDAGSWFFLGGFYTTLPLQTEQPAAPHCGACSACLDACPTGAIVAPYQVDARRCIAYLTIEHAGSIPVELRPLLGNRIYGCDDCQLVCPWNRFARTTREPDFAVRHALDDSRLRELFAWSAEDFAERMAGSAIHRIGWGRWLRNIAVALGNGEATEEAMQALAARLDGDDVVLREHVQWAMAQLEARRVVGRPAVSGSPRNTLENDEFDGKTA